MVCNGDIAGTSLGCLLSVSAVFTLYVCGAQRIYQLSEAHEIFVTGLEFAPSTTSRAIVGPSVDFTLFSISADSQIKAHQVESRRMFISFVYFVSELAIL